jgi:hypothetical protein
MRRLAAALIGMPALSAPAVAQDAQLRQLLLSSAWCSFTYNKTTGASRTERAQFAPNGTMFLSTGAQSHSSGPHGSATGQSASSRSLQWRVERSELLFSEDGVTWEAVEINVKRSSNGGFIIVADGKEYAQCR